MSFIVALLGLSIIILVHEFGHFFVARSAGIPVSEFSIGMGKSIFQKQWGDTVFSLRAIPLGGYVRIAGLEDKDENRIEISFINKLKILLSGSFNNFVFAWMVFFFIFFISGIPGNASNIVEHVYSGGPAYKAGVMKGDIVLSVNGQDVSSGKEVVKKLTEEKGDNKIVVIRRGDKEHVFNILPKVEAGRSVIGIRLDVEKERAFSFFSSIGYSLEQCLNILLMTYKGLWMLISREIGVDQVYGPVGIINLTSQATSQGILYFFSFLAVLSINLAVINLFPFPALDGGRIVMLFLDKLLGDKLSKRIEYNFHFIGFIILILLVIYISYFDIQKLLLK